MTNEALDKTIAPPPSHSERRSADLIHKVEQGVYIAIGAILILAIMLALAGSSKLLVEGLKDWSGEEQIVHIIDRLLFVLMMAEILHTVHVSVRTGTLMCEPFLIVRLIACIRRVLVSTLEISQISQPDNWDPSKLSLFQSSMIELGVLAILIVVLVGSICLMRFMNLRSDNNDSKSDNEPA